MYNIRRLTPLECWRLMGFTDEEYKMAESAGVSRTNLYKQAGNSVVVDVLSAIFTNLFADVENVSLNELFAGIGAQVTALQRINKTVNVIGISEIDVPAVKSYEALHGKTYNYGDIRAITELKYADFWTYTFPCVDISVAGRQAGLVQGVTRSGLLYEVQRLLQNAVDMQIQPKYLMLENVKNLTSGKFINSFNDWLYWLDTVGYNSYWQILNAQDYGIPQHRERVFVISIRKDVDTGNFAFPKPTHNIKCLADFMLDIDATNTDYAVNKPWTSEILQQLELLEQTGYRRDHVIQQVVREHNRTVRHQQDALQSAYGVCRCIPAGTHGSTPHLLKTVYWTE